MSRYFIPLMPACITFGPLFLALFDGMAMRLAKTRAGRARLRRRRAP
jgi:hypothetical protein